jgi:hypothetical protein
LKVKCAKFHHNRSKTVDLHTKQTFKQRSNLARFYRTLATLATTRKAMEGRTKPTYVVIGRSGLSIYPIYISSMEVELVPTLMIDDAETKMRTNAAVRVELKTWVLSPQNSGMQNSGCFRLFVLDLGFSMVVFMWFSLCCPIFVINLRSPCLLPCFFDFRSIIVIPSLQTVFFKTPLICIIAIVSITHLIVLDF